LTDGPGAGVRLFRPAGVCAPGPALLWIHGNRSRTVMRPWPACRRYSRWIPRGWRSPVPARATDWARQLALLARDRGWNTLCSRDSGASDVGWPL